MNGKAILASLLTIGVAATMLGVGTMAYFSDEETSTGNTFTAGTMDLKVDGEDDLAVFHFIVTNAKPGDSGSHTFILHNAGNISGDLSICVSSITESPGTTPEPEPTPDEGELAEAMIVALKADLTHDGDYEDILDGETLYSGDLAGIAEMIYSDITTLPSDLNVLFEWSIPTAVGNEIMDDSASFDITFALEQVE